jgi:hypothetical protein
VLVAGAAPVGDALAAQESAPVDMQWGFKSAWSKQPIIKVSLETMKVVNGLLELKERN